MNQEVTAKMAKYCAFQERCKNEIIEKLKSCSISTEEKKEILNWLEENNFVDDKRFAITFAQSKFKSKKWGRIKIRHHLENKNLSENIISEALETISEKDYMSLFEKLLKEKQETTTGDNDYNKNHKIARFLIARGFEPDIIWHYLRV